MCKHWAMFKDGKLVKTFGIAKKSSCVICSECGYRKYGKVKIKCLPTKSFHRSKKNDK